MTSAVYACRSLCFDLRGINLKPKKSWYKKFPLAGVFTMTNTILLFILGLIVLILGADLLVRGASRLAAAFGVSPLVIGLTIVAIGTASPEIAVSLKAAAGGQGDLTLGNVLGSNIFNILFILGITSIVAPIVIAEQLIRKDAPIMLGVSLLTLALALDGKLGWLDGSLLLIGMIVYIVFALKQSRAESREVQKEYAAGICKEGTAHGKANHPQHRLHPDWAGTAGAWLELAG